MKQKKFGIKVQNWHRPLGRTQLRQRFLALRDDDSEFTKRGLIISHGNEGIETDYYWNPYDPYEHYPDASYYDEDSYFDYNLNYLWQRFLTQAKYAVEGSVLETIATHSFKRIKSIEEQKNDCFSEIKMAELINKLKKEQVHKGGLDSLFNDIMHATTEHDYKPLKQFSEKSRESKQLAKYLLLFSPFWVRRPEEWQGGSSKDFLIHLFQIHNSPDFLHSAILNERYDPLKWLCWFIILGQGGSLKRAASLFNWEITGRFSHHLLFVPEGLSATEACLFAKIKQLGGDEEDFQRILTTHTLVVDPTEQSADPTFMHFWKTSIQWLIARKDELEEIQYAAIMRWALHKHTEALRMARTEGQVVNFFSWKGRTVRSTLENTEEYLRSLSLPYLQYEWGSHHWNWQYIDESEDEWVFEELLSGEELFVEGNAMGHCVSSYASRCASGYSAIVSIRFNNKPCLTVELNPSTNKIVQLRGRHNRAADTSEGQVVLEWLRKVVNVSD